MLIDSEVLKEILTELAVSSENKETIKSYVYTIKVIEKVEGNESKTNGDRIRNMTNEEWAKWLSNNNLCGICSLYNGTDCKGTTGYECEEGLIEYFNKESDKQ